MQLLYVMDPMCSWCWAFREPLAQLRQSQPELDIRVLMGGLAPDSEEPMPEALRLKIQQIWHHIEAQTGAKFNHDFWRLNTPKRSTYPACRAVITADLMVGPNKSLEMVEAIQQAYYQRALNPSNLEVLEQLAGEIGLDVPLFTSLINGEQVAQALASQLADVGQLGIGGFPALLLQQEQDWVPLALGFTRLDKLQQRLKDVTI